MAGGGHNKAKFKEAILALIRSKDWDEAKAEWKLFFVYNDPEDRSCECEHSPIHQICVIENRINRNKTEVGNVCVRRFLRLMSNRIFSVIKRLKTDIQKSLNEAAIDLFVERDVITTTEGEDYKSYWRKRKNMTPSQRSQKLAINERVLRYIEKETRSLIAAARAHGLRVPR